MNETLKGVAHIGAELAAAKADLQLEMERHRKTWRQLDSLRDVAREALAVIERLRPEGNGIGTIVRLKAALSLQAAPQGKFRMGDLVKKTTGSEWEGHICGTYSTEQTPEGYAVESAAHRGSVQIYPAKALELVPIHD